ncbi:MAG: orotidine-5'-phosphate decarboxylase [Lentisphaerae bacterium]|nr:orotidine-5'-phosphate decarboxylase [Lentisphaerota bacterium]
MPLQEHASQHARRTPALVVALDVPSAKDAARAIDALPPAVQWFKVGLELFTAEGPACLEPIRNAGRKVFLDLKLHDIPNTVARAVTAAARRKVNMLTVHAGGGRAMLEAAARAAADAGPDAPAVVAVTALTSLDQSDLADTGVTRPLRQHAQALARLAIDAGVNGLVCSPLEVAALRETLGPTPILVTPGVRPAGTEAGDQRRVATPEDAARAGADFLVVGRPILQAPNPSAAAQQVLDAIAGAR